MDTLEPFTVTAIALQNIYALNTVTAEADKLFVIFWEKNYFNELKIPNITLDKKWNFSMKDFFSKCD